MSNLNYKIGFYYRLSTTFLISLAVVLPAFSFSTFTLVGDFVTTMKYISFMGVIAMWGFITSIYIIICLFRSTIILPSINYVSLLIIIWYIYVVFNAMTKGAHLQDRDLVTLSLCILLYFLSTLAFQSHSVSLTKDIILKILLIGSSLESVIGLLQLYGLVPSLNKYFSITGSFKNPAPFSLFLAVVLPLALSTWLFSETGKEKADPKRKCLALIATLLIGLILPVTNIRTSWIAAVLGITIVLQYRYRLIKKIMKGFTPAKRAIFYSCLFFLLTIFIYGLYLVKPASAAGRVIVWKVTIQQFFNHPFFGAGYSNFSKRYGIWQAAYFQEYPERLEATSLLMEEKDASLADNVTKAYNEYLQLSVESGIIGLILFIGIIFIVIIRSMRIITKSPSYFIVGALSSFCAILICGMFSYPFQSLPTLVLFFILLGYLSTKIEPISFFHHRQYLFTDYIWSKTGLNILVFIFSLTVFIWGFKTVLSMQSYADWRIVKSLFIQNEKEVEKKYKVLYLSLKEDPLFLIDYGFYLNKNKHFKQAYQILQQAKSLSANPSVYIFSGQALEGLGCLKEAAGEFELAHFIIPHHLYPTYLLAKLYAGHNDTSSAVYYAKKIIQNSPKVESAMSDQIIHEMKTLLETYKR